MGAGNGLPCSLPPWAPGTVPGSDQKYLCLESLGSDPSLATGRVNQPLWTQFPHFYNGSNFYLTGVYEDEIGDLLRTHLIHCRKLSTWQLLQLMPFWVQSCPFPPISYEVPALPAFPLGSANWKSGLRPSYLSPRAERPSPTSQTQRAKLLASKAWQALLPASGKGLGHSGR